MAVIKTEEEIRIMAEAGKRLAAVLRALEAEVKPGVPTSRFDELSRKLFSEVGGEPAFLNYRPRGSRAPFPAAVCVSVNKVLVHGLPSSLVLYDGDIVKLDLGIRYKGFHADTGITVGVGTVSPVAAKLIKVTRTALSRAIENARVGYTLGDIGWAIEETVKRGGFSVAETLVGHGIGRELHEPPDVFNVGRPGEGKRLVAGMVLAIEPMVVAAREGDVRELSDGSFVAASGALTAHFEHTVAITEDGPRVLTA